MLGGGQRLDVGADVRWGAEGLLPVSLSSCSSSD